MSYILTAKNLKTTTNPVDVASAAEPTTGQVLTATSATTAGWETPTTGVPYTGATADVDLGSWILTAIQVYGTSSVKTPLLVDAGGTNIIDSPGRTLCDVSGGGILDFYTANALKILKSGTAYGAILDPSSTTDNRTFTFPDVAGTIALTSDITAARVPRVGTTTSSATPTINTDNYDMYTLTAQAADITSFTTNLSGTPTDGQKLIIRITGTAARAITWGASFSSSTVTLPTTTVTTAMLTVGFIYDSVSATWVCSAAC